MVFHGYKITIIITIIVVVNAVIKI
jgi:hypothetical protein